MKKFLGLLFALLLLGFSGMANADLMDRGGGLIYDTDLDITWLADANLAATTTFGVAGINVDGTMNASESQQWIAAMNSANFLGFGDWRLPSALNQDGSGPCSGFNCSDSEMGDLYYDELGGIASTTVSVLDSGDPDLTLFSNIQLSTYWSTPTAFLPTVLTHSFSFLSGNQGFIGNNNDVFAMAVRDGDVPTAPVPEPATMFLFGAGLVGLVGVRRRGKNK